MNITIHPASITGKINAPASKSSMQRACAAALLYNGTTLIRLPGNSNDDKAALEIIQQLGAKVCFNEDSISIESNGVQPIANIINCGESGLGIRMFTPILALSDQEFTVEGSGSLKGRPLHFFEDVLPHLGVSLTSLNGYLPISVKGPLKPTNIAVDGTLSSQYLTGLLFAYSAANASNCKIHVKGLKSKPYIDLTLSVMKAFGMRTPVNKEYTDFYFEEVAVEEPIKKFVNKTTAINYPKNPIQYTVERDWSGGAFLLVAGAIAGNIIVNHLDMGSTQADKAIIEALLAAQAGVAIDAKSISLTPATLVAFDFDATDCPDLFPPLVALAAYCEGITTIHGVHRLKHKESNRGITLQEEFAKMGVKIECDDDIMRIHGGGQLNGAVVSSRHDHRIAMACAIAALGATGSTTIEDAEAINKSYPDFFSDLRSLQASIDAPFRII